MLNTQAVRLLFDHFQVVVRKADRPESDRQDQHRDHFGTADSEEKACHGHTENDHETSHIRCPRLAQMALKSEFSLCLSCLDTSQKRDQVSAGYGADRILLE